MHNDVSLIATIAISLAYALVGGVLAAKLKLPPLVGYIAAGMAVGPFTPGFVADVHLAPQLAEIGVILLMFGVGTHFSIASLLAVRGVAIPGALVQIIGATVTGAALAVSWGWSWEGGIVFGLALSVASTVVLLRALEARGSMKTEEGRTAVGWLIVEDLITVLALVVLPVLVAPGAGAPTGAAVDAPGIWSVLALTLLKVVAFATAMLWGGGRLFPWVLDLAKRTGSRELFTLAAVTLAISVAFLSARLFGVSYALGAFFAGLVVSRSDLSHRATAHLRPFEDAFGALFFVAVGMLFDPGILTREPLRLLLTLGIVIVGKSLGAMAIVVLLRKPLRLALTVAAALAQIGEFSFILIALGVSLGILPNEAQSLVVAAALISITLNPLVHRAAQGFAHPAAVLK